MLNHGLFFAACSGLLRLAALVPAAFSSRPAAGSLRAWAAGIDPDTLTGWVEEHLRASEQAIGQLLSVPSPRTVANTLAPYDRAIAELGVAGSQAGLLHSVAPEKALRDQAEALAQKISQTAVELSLNPKVYHALASIDRSSVTAGADPSTRHYLDRTLLQYRLAGVDRDDATRRRIQQLQDRTTQLGLTFGRNVQEQGNTVTVDDPAELDGLPPDFLARHPLDGEGRIRLTTDHPDYQPVMTFATSDRLRRAMFLAYNTRAYPANRQVLLDLLATRHELATLLGFSTWADFATADQMMGSAARVQSFLAALDAASSAASAREYAMVLDFARQRRPGLSAIDAASATYWYEQYRRAAFDFDSQSVRPYLPYPRVQQGVLDLAARLFHVEFRPAADAPVWHPSVTAWDVFDRSPSSEGPASENPASESSASSQPLGRFYLDMHPRPGKDKWFSAFPLVPGIRGAQMPEAALICNFPGGEPTPDDPGLLQYSDVITFFHEFGHLMHAILGGQQPWAGVSGIATEGDFVEAPSQMLEEFFRNPRLLQSFARHYQTGAPLPTEQIERMNRASAFGRGNWVRAQLFYTRFSLDLHNRPPSTIDLDALLQAGYAAALPYAWVEGNRLYASFTHLNGYSSNYYTYLFDKVIALDFYRQFDPEHLVDGPAALRYRRQVLEPGGSQPGEALVRNFLGRPQTFAALEDWMNEEFQADRQPAEA